MNRRTLTSAALALALSFLGCVTHFDLSPIAPKHVPVVDATYVSPGVVSYSGKDWNIEFPRDWVINDKNQRVSDDVIIDVTATFDAGDKKTITFVASSLSFVGVPIDADAFGVAAILLLERNGLRVDDAVAMMVNGIDATLSIAVHKQKGILVLQLAVMNGTTGHMFRCMSTDVDIVKIAEACGEVFSNVKLTNGENII